MSTLPTPSFDAKIHSQQLVELIQFEIEKAAGWIDFAQFMQLALYAPGLGYYSAGNQKFGDAKHGGGDFVTAPQISPLFAQTLTNQITQVTEDYSTKALKMTPFGFRAGVDGKFNRQLSWAYGAEMGLRPSLQGRMFYLLFKLTFPIYGTNLDYKVESFGK